MSPTALAALAASVSVIFGGILAYFSRVHPKVRKFFTRLNGTFDAVAGREPYVDPASGRLVEALPPLTSRIANVETAVVEIKDLMVQQASLEKRVAAHDQLLAKHSAIIGSLTAGQMNQVERIVTKDESAQMWRAVAEANTDTFSDDN